MAAGLFQTESGEDSGSEGEETGDNYSCDSLLPPSSRMPRTCATIGIRDGLPACVWDGTIDDRHGETGQKPTVLREQTLYVFFF